MTKRELDIAKREILIEAEKIECKLNVTTELKLAYSKSRAIDEFLLTKYFPVQKSPSNRSKIRLLRAILKKYESDVLETLLGVKNNFEEVRKNTKPNKQNLFLIAGTKNLYLSNKYTRTITTVLGNRLESILEIDRSRCFDTEIQFNLKIPGIDKFILDPEGKIRHVQVKTKKDTLTGSQSKRSIIELSIHPKPIFAALFDFGTWTFPNHNHVKRMSGSDFWALVDLEYDMVLKEVCKSLQRIEKALY